MLAGLSIRDVVLIESLSLGFAPGLTVLTGETGAGKSILLDALALALGERADSGLVRHGAAQAAVTAEFELPSGHPIHALLAEHELPADSSLVIRRTLTADGRSRCFVNDQAVSAGLVRRLAETLVEIHGQFETHGLFDVRTHPRVLDAYGSLGAPRQRVAAAWRAWRSAEAEHGRLAADAASARAEELYLRDTVAELEKLAAAPGEEAALAELKQRLQHREKLLDALAIGQRDLAGDRGAELAVSTARRALERVADRAGGAFDAIIAALDRAQIEIAEAVAGLEIAAAAVDAEGQDLTTVDDRLFALRHAGRKYAVAPDALAALAEQLKDRLAGIADNDGRIAEAARQAAAGRAAYVAAAHSLSEARRQAAKRLDAAVAAELAPLKLDRARFVTGIEPAAEPEWGESGADRVAFTVSTNPGQPLGALAKIASGGELARFMLAIKVVLAGASPVSALVFDEVDSGIGGATADAVGERLARLAEAQQVLVVTHSPQVAARATHHWQVRKQMKGGKMATELIALGPEGRREEIARMLSGAEVTAEARAAAARLIAHPSSGRPPPGRLL